MNRNCFTYGSLMCTDIMAAVCGLAVSGQAATLTGHRRHPVRGEAYPGMVPAAGHSVAGVIYPDLPSVAIARLDAFEGLQYERRSVVVQLADGGRIEADTYVFRAEFAGLLLPGDWDFERFLREGKVRFEQQYVGYDRL